MAPRRRILVVDDEPNFQDLVGQYLELEGYAVMKASDGLEALNLAEMRPPDLVILDLTLPGLDGLEVCRRLRASSAVPILMLTGRATEADKLAGFCVGTDDYVTKPFLPRELVMRVQAIMRRVEAVSLPAMVLDGTLRFGNLVIRPELREACRDGVLLDLTSREFDLLHFLASHPRQVFTRQQLLQHVWSYDFGDEEVVTVQMSRLREKVESDSSRPRHLRTVWRVGYKFEP
jgi:DNA-binding response OmpR family regulator